MSDERPRRNFGDPTYEPTDHDLRELAQEAFADVGERSRQALEASYARVAELEAAAMARAERAAE